MLCACWGRSAYTGTLLGMHWIIIINGRLTTLFRKDDLILLWRILISCIDKFVLNYSINLTTHWAIPADDKLMKVYYVFPQKIGFEISCKFSPKKIICTKSQSQSFGGSKNNIRKCRLMKLLPSMLSIKAQLVYYHN